MPLCIGTWPFLYVFSLCTHHWYKRTKQCNWDIPSISTKVMKRLIQYSNAHSNNQLINWLLNHIPINLLPIKSIDWGWIYQLNLSVSDSIIAYWITAILHAEQIITYVANWMCKCNGAWLSALETSLSRQRSHDTMY